MPPIPTWSGPAARPFAIVWLIWLRGLWRRFSRHPPARVEFQLPALPFFHYLPCLFTSQDWACSKVADSWSVPESIHGLQLLAWGHLTWQWILYVPWTLPSLFASSPALTQSIPDAFTTFCVELHLFQHMRSRFAFQFAACGPFLKFFLVRQFWGFRPRDEPKPHSWPTGTSSEAIQQYLMGLKFDW